MAVVKPLATTGEVFLDARDGGRALRVSWHFDSDLVTLSIWRENVCASSFQLPAAEVPDLIELLRRGLDASNAVQVARHHRVS
jgi:hypothetical protein